MRIVARVVGFLILAVLFLGASLGALAWCVWMHPDWVLRDATLNYVKEYVTTHYPADHLTWDRAHVEARSLSFREKTARFSVADFCVRFDDGSLDACFKEITLSLKLVLDGRHLMITELRPVHLVGERMIIRSTPAKPTVPKADSDEDFSFPSFLRATDISDVHIFTPFEYVDGDQTFSGRVEITGSGSNEGFRAHVRGEEKLVERHRLQHTARVNVDVVNPGLDWAISEWKIIGDASYEAKADGQSAKADLAIRSLGGLHLVYAVHGSFLDGKRDLRVEASGALRENSLKSDLKATLSNVAPQVPSVEMEGCPIETIWKDGHFKDAKLTLKGCHTWLVLRDLRDVGQRYKVKIARRVGLEWQAEVQSFISPSAEHPLDANLDVKLASLENELFRLTGAVRGTVSMTSYGAGVSPQLKGHADLHGDLKDYKNLVRVLNDNRMLVPAPLHDLNGRGSWSVTADGDSESQGFRVPFTVVTDLSSADQKLKIKGDGTFNVPPAKSTEAVSLKAEILLQEAVLVLPHLELASPPSFVPDSRIKKYVAPTATSAQAAAPRFKYDVRLVTAPGAALVLKTNLTVNPVPILMDLNFVSGRDTGGSLGLKNYTLELFKRKALVEHFNLRLSGDRAMDGTIRVDYPQYTIWIMVTGPMAAPQVKLISEPPLPESDITAVLIFGQPAKNLDPTGQSSSSDVAAAIAGNAMSVASLYYLASTPIQSVSYDPARGVVYAQVGLGHGTSLNLGVKSDEVESVGLVKRLGKSWRINTTVRDSASADASTNRVVRSFLEWFKNY